jgi:hypothetical protein
MVGAAKNATSPFYEIQVVGRAREASHSVGFDAFEAKRIRENAI